MDIVRKPQFLKDFLGQSLYQVKARPRYSLVVLFKEPKQASLSAPDEDLLSKILQSVGIRLSEVRLVNLDYPHPEDAWESWQEIPSTKLLSFGAQLSFTEPSSEYYTPQKNEAVLTLFAHSLEELARDTEKKKQLWKGLQKIFL